MDPEKRKRLEAAGYVFGDFADFLGLDDIERKMIEFRTDLGSAIRRIREERGQTRAKFARVIGSSLPELARIEIGFPDVPLDLMLRAYFTVGGIVRYGFESPPIAPSSPSDPLKSDEAATKLARSTARRKVAKAVKA